MSMCSRSNSNVVQANYSKRTQPNCWSIGYRQTIPIAEVQMYLGMGSIHSKQPDSVVFRLRRHTHPARHDSNNRVEGKSLAFQCFIMFHSRFVAVLRRWYSSTKWFWILGTSELIRYFFPRTAYYCGTSLQPLGVQKLDPYAQELCWFELTWTENRKTH